MRKNRWGVKVPTTCNDPITTDVPETYRVKKEMKVPETHHKWKDGPVATLKLGVKAKVKLSLPKKTKLSDAEVSGVVQLVSFDLNDFPGWIEKHYINPLLGLLQPKVKDIKPKKLFDDLNLKERRVLDRIWIENGTFYPDGNDLVIQVKGKITL
jgi:hypothetical protein